MITVKGPDGVTYNFPDAASPDQIEAAMKENYPSDSSSSSSSSLQEKIQNMPGIQGSLARGGQYALNRIADIEQGAIAAVPKAAQFINEGISQAFPNGQKLWAKAASLNPMIPKPGVDYMQETGRLGIGSGEQGFVPDMAREAGGYLPFGALGEASVIPKVAGKIESALGKSILGEMLAGGAYGAVNNPENRALGALEGTATNIAGAGLAQGVAKSLEKLRPSRLFRGNLSEDQLIKNMEDAKGTPTALGNVIANRNLQRMSENYLPEVPFSGATDAAEKASQVAEGKADNFINRILGKNSKEDVGGQLQQALKESKEAVRNEKNARFNALNDAADKSGTKVGSENLAETANQYLSSIKEDPRLALEVPSELVSRLETYANTNLPNNFKQTGVLRGKLGEKSRQYSREGQDYEAGIYSGLKGALEKDWNKAIESSGEPNLKTMRDEANQYYKENYAPFKQPEVMKFIDKGGDSDTLLNSFVKTGNGQDRANLLEKLMSKLPEEKRGLVPYGYLAKAIDNDGLVNPAKFASQFEKLGDRQRKVMFPNGADIKEAEDIANLARMNKKGQYSMLNAETGQKNLGALIKGAGGALIGSAGLAGGFLPAAATALGIWGTARGLNKGLTSENVREALIRAMLNPEQKFKPKPVRSQTLAQALMNRNQEEERQNG